MVDPIGITNISAISVISPPLVSSLISIPPTPSSSYRMPRTFVGTIYCYSTNSHHKFVNENSYLFSALEDSLFTLVLIDSQTGALHWMIIDIPQSILAIDVRMGGVEVRRLNVLHQYNFISACIICNPCRRKDRIMFIILLYSSSTINFSSFYSSVL